MNHTELGNKLLQIIEDVTGSMFCFQGTMTQAKDVAERFSAVVIEDFIVKQEAQKAQAKASFNVSLPAFIELTLIEPWCLRVVVNTHHIRAIHSGEHKQSVVYLDTKNVDFDTNFYYGASRFLANPINVTESIDEIMERMRKAAQ